VSVFSLVLAVLYTFCASVVLLNVLIAIASDSVRGMAFEPLSKMDGTSLTHYAVKTTPVREMPGPER
jgi:hypothetical protein